MAFTQVTDAQLGDAEFELDCLDKLQELFEFHVLVLKGLAGSVQRAAIFRSGQKLPPSFPALRLEVQSSDERHIEMGGATTGKRLVRVRCIVTVLDRIGNDAVKVARSHAKLVGRVRGILSRNRTLDGLSEDLIVSPAEFGFFDSPGGPLIGAQVRVDVELRVSQL